MMATWSAMLLVLTLCGHSSAQTSFTSVCSDTNFIVNSSYANRPGPAGNSPVVQLNRNTCAIRVQACSLSSCQGNVPGVTVEVVLSQPFDQISGVMVEIGNTGGNAADDCNPNEGNTPHSAWGQSQRGHGGVTVFGTPDRVIYGGCAAGLNFGTYTYRITPQTVPTTRRIRFEIHQSVINEIVVLNLNGIMVRTASTPTPTAAPTFAPTPLHPSVVTLNAQMSTVMSTQQSIIAAQAAMSTLASEQVATNVLQSVAVQSDISQLVAGQSLLMEAQSNMSMRVSTMSTSVAQIVASISQAVAGLPVASTGGGGTSITGQPVISTDTSTLRVQGGGRQLSLETDCATINPCQILQALNALGNL